MHVYKNNKTKNFLTEPPVSDKTPHLEKICIFNTYISKESFKFIESHYDKLHQEFKNSLICKLLVLETMPVIKRTFLGF